MICIMSLQSSGCATHLGLYIRLGNACWSQSSTQPPAELTSCFCNGGAPERPDRAAVIGFHRTSKGSTEAARGGKHFPGQEIESRGQPARI